MSWYRLLLSCVLLAGCARDDARVQVTDAWSPAAPPGAAVLAVYAQISVREPDTLTGITSPLAESVQLHSMMEADGMMQMREVPQLDLAPGEVVRLEPGGMHLMLMNPHEVPSVDSQIPLTFHFTHAGEVAVTATVRSR